MGIPRALLPFLLVAGLAFSQDEDEVLTSLLPAFTDPSQAVSGLPGFFATGGPRVRFSLDSALAVPSRGITNFLREIGPYAEVGRLDKFTEPLAKRLKNLPLFKQMLSDGHTAQLAFISRLFGDAEKNDHDFNYIRQEVLDIPYRLQLSRLAPDFADEKLDTITVEIKAKNKFFSKSGHEPRSGNKEDAALLNRYIRQIDENETKRKLALVPKQANLNETKEHYLRELDRVSGEMYNLQLRYYLPYAEEYQKILFHHLDEGVPSEAITKKLFPFEVLKTSADEEAFVIEYKGANGQTKQIRIKAPSEFMDIPAPGKQTKGGAIPERVLTSNLPAVVTQIQDLKNPNHYLTNDEETLKLIVRDQRWQAGMAALDALRVEISEATSDGELAKAFARVKSNNLGTKTVANPEGQAALRLSQIQSEMKYPKDAPATIKQLQEELPLSSYGIEQARPETLIKWSGLAKSDDFWIKKALPANEKGEYSIATLASLHNLARFAAEAPTNVGRAILSFYHQGLKLSLQAAAVIAILTSSYATLRDHPPAAPSPAQESRTELATAPEVANLPITKSDKSILDHLDLRALFEKFQAWRTARVTTTASDAGGTEHRTGNSRDEGMVLSGRPDEATNTGVSRAGQNENRPAFSVKALHGVAPTQFFLSNPDEYRVAALVAPNLKSDLTLQSTVPLIPDQGYLSIPAAEFYQLDDYKVTTTEGQPVESQLFFHPHSGTYTISVPPGHSYTLNARFTKTSDGSAQHAPDEYFDKSYLLEISHQLDEAGFKSLANAVKDRYSGPEQVSTTEFAGIFAQNSYYTNEKEKITIASMRARNLNPNNIFWIYRGFLALGELCGECDVGNSMYRDALSIPFRDRRNLKVHERALMILTEDGKGLRLMGHALSEIENSEHENLHPLRADATPAKQMTPELQLAFVKAREVEEKAQKEKDEKNPEAPHDKFKVDDLYVLPEQTRAPRKPKNKEHDEATDPPDEPQAGVAESEKSTAVTVKAPLAEDDPRRVNREWKVRWKSVFETELEHLKLLYDNANLPYHLQSFEGPLRSTIGQLILFCDGYKSYEEVYRELLPGKDPPIDQWQGLRDIYTKYVEESSSMKDAFVKMIHENPRMALRAPVLLSKEIQEALTVRVRSTLADATGGCKRFLHPAGGSRE